MAVQTHTAPPPELELPATLHDDRHRFGTVDVPVVTTSASFRHDILQNFGEKAHLSGNEIVFSRAHYSMAVAVMRAAVESKLTTWLIDPLNYMTEKDWGKISLVVKVGELAARFPILKHVKDVFDTIVREKSPLTQAIKEQLLYATARIDEKTIVSMHYETGNILARNGKRVLQVVTDPHVRPQYLYEAERPNITYAVFDQDTKNEFLTKAGKSGKKVNPAKIVVTGPPVDPRIVGSRAKKTSGWLGTRPLRLAFTTGGLGQNKNELGQALTCIAPKIKEGKIQVILYASTLPDFMKMYQEIAERYGIEVGKRIDDENAALRIFYYSSIVDVNQALIDYVFPWSDGFITKPSGDMAYDAVAAGCFLLTLEPWGIWEKNIAKIFTSVGVSQEAKPRFLAAQLDDLIRSGWIEDAIKKALAIDKLFLNGAKKVVDLQQKLTVE